MLFILLILLGLYAYSFYNDLPLNAKDLSISFKQELPNAVNTSSNLVQFAQSMRFSKNELSYYFQEGCVQAKIDSTREAFKILEEQTEVLSFKESSSFAEDIDILIKCSEESKETTSDEKNKRTFIAGEGGPTKFLELSPYSLIMQGEIQLYSSRQSKECSEPLVEIHELLHVLGYDHIDDKTSILYPYLSCDQELKPNIIQDIKELYSEPAKAEVLIANISASKAGRYLDFSIEVENTGLLKAEKVKLEVFAWEKSVKEFNMESLIPGSSRTLELTNLQLPSSRADSVRFVITTTTEEYSIENNVVEMIVE